ncbi:MAG: alpha/beta fold hydrolase [Shimia sp.]|nr:alpha/beta fold hydrolase [Shimia sp.]
MTFLWTGQDQYGPTFVFAHGSGAAMDTPFMETVAQGLAARGVRVVRIEFSYMAARRTGGAKRPPPKVALLEQEYRDVLQELALEGTVVIGGKSMGGRVASMIADDLGSTGVLCLGYPFHPKGKPDRLRTAHLQVMQTPTLICQGSRDPLGTHEEVVGYGVSGQVEVAWFEDGDHDLKPRKRVTGVSHETQLAAVCDRAAAWVIGLS